MTSSASVLCQRVLLMDMHVSNGYKKAILWQTFVPNKYGLTNICGAI